MRNVILLGFAAFLLVTLTSAVGEAATPPYLEGLQWSPVGPGGGGAQYNPAIAPKTELDPNDPDMPLGDLMFGFCDMGGIYRSVDRGHTWSMYTFAEAQMPVAYSPFHFNPKFADPNTAFIAVQDGLLKTTDAGKTWRFVSQAGIPQCIAISGADPLVMFYCSDAARLYTSLDGGETWREITSFYLRVGDVLQDMYIDPYSPGDPARPVIYAAGANTVWRSTDGGNAWQARYNPLPSICDFEGTTWEGQRWLYVTVPGTGIVETTDTTIWVERNVGFNVEDAGPNMQLGVGDEGDVLYVGSHENGGPTIYKTTDHARHWSLILTDPGADNFPPSTTVARDWMTLGFGWAWGEEPHEIEVSPNDSNSVAFSEDGRTFRSDDGGQSWFCCNNNETSPGSDWWGTTGFETTTNYHVHFAPWNTNLVYITYTDIGLFRSQDGGQSWRLASTGSLWTNTFYDLTFDPDVPGKMWAVASDNHDLPHEKMIRRDVADFEGGVLLSTDYGVTWTPIGIGFPGGAPTSIVVDPKSPVGSRTLYVAIAAYGVFKSVDDGASWLPANTGLGWTYNMNAWMLKLMPDGVLYCAVTESMTGTGYHRGALFKSVDGAAVWELVNTGQNLPYIYGFDVDPADQNIIYVATFDGQDTDYWDPPLHGIWKTTDGGRTWVRTFDYGDMSGVAIDPERHSRVYATIEQGESFWYFGGLYVSEDFGETWTKAPGLPFERYGPNYVSFDPNDSQRIYVTTFGGGVWTTTIPHQQPSDIMYALSDEETSLRGANWYHKTTLRFTPAATDNWLILGFAEYSCSSPDYNVLVRMTVDGKTVSGVRSRYVGSTEYATFMTAKVVRLNRTEHRIRLDFTGSHGAARTRMRSARIIAVRQQDLDMLFSREKLPVALGTAPKNCATLTWTPPTSGDYLLLWSAEFKGDVRSSTRLAAKLDGATVDESVVRTRGRTNVMPFMSMTVANLDKRAHSLVLSAWKDGPSGYQFVRRPRLVAIRLSDSRFSQYRYAASNEESTSTSLGAVEKLRQTWDVPVLNNLIMLSTFRLSGSSTLYPVEAAVIIDDTVTAGWSVRRPRSTGDLMNAGAAGLFNLPAGAHQFEVEYNTGGDSMVGIKYVHVLILPL